MYTDVFDHMDAGFGRMVKNTIIYNNSVNNSLANFSKQECMSSTCMSASSRRIEPYSKIKNTIQGYSYIKITIIKAIQYLMKLKKMNHDKEYWKNAEKSLNLISGLILASNSAVVSRIIQWLYKSSYLKMLMDLISAFLQVRK